MRFNFGSRFGRRRTIMTGISIMALCMLSMFFLPVAAIVGPNINGLIVQFSGKDYSSIMIIGPFFMLAAFILMAGVKRGEASKTP